MKETILRLKPPVMAALYLLGAWMLQKLFPGFQTAKSPWGAVLAAAAGMGLILWAWRLFKRRDNPICPTEKPRVMIGEGPYRALRNPMYLGIVLILTAAAFATGWGFAWFVPLCFFATVDRVFIPHEESNLEAAFGSAFLDYKKKIKRWGIF